MVRVEKVKEILRNEVREEAKEPVITDWESLLH